MWAHRELGQNMKLWGKPIVFGFVLAQFEWLVDLLKRPKNLIFEFGQENPLNINFYVL